MEISVLVLVLSALACGVYCMPRDRSHRGLYDQWKSVPFVDNPDDTKAKLGDYDNSLAKIDTTNSLHDKYEQLYNKYNKEHGRVVGDGVDTNTDSGDWKSLNSDSVDIENEETDSKSKILDVKPKEGGLEDMSEELPDDFPVSDLTDVSGTEKRGRRHRKNKGDKKKKRRQERNSVKKDLSEKESKKRRKGKKNDIETANNPIEEDDLEVNMEKFYEEHPDFQKNVATISDKGETDGDDLKTNEDDFETEDDTNTKAEVVEDNVSESLDDGGVKDVYDDDDDFDDSEEQDNEESKSDDASSEEFQYYDYYDTENDSSYSSSEQQAEREMHDKAPYDWFKNFDRMQGDQPAQTDDLDKETTTDINKKYSEDLKTVSYDIQTDAEETSTDSIIKDNDIKADIEEKAETIPKTDVEPSTSPNPPTSKKDVKSVVTQPAYPEWKERVETWNLIESKPVESCSDAADCSPGRMCRFGLCLCGQPDYCEGHDKPVCGSDGRRYPSHCELHRTACVLGVHIRIDADGLCFVNDEDTTTDAEDKNMDSSMETAENSVESVDNLEEIVDNSEESADNTVESIDNTEETVDKTPSGKLVSSSTTLATIENSNTDSIDIPDSSDQDNETPVDVVINTDNSETDSEDDSEETDTNDSEDNDKHSDNIKLDTAEDTIKTTVLAKVIKDVLKAERNENSNDSNDSDEDSTSVENDDTDGANVEKPKIESVDVVINDDDNYDDSYDDDDDDDYDDDLSDEEDTDDVDSTEDDDDDEYDYDDDYYEYSDEYDEDYSDESDDEDEVYQDDEKPSLVPLYCTPDIYMKFKADVLQYHCILFEEEHCDRQTQEEKQRLAAIMFNYFDKNYSGHIEKEELWEQQLDERMDKISSLCTLVDLVLFDELGQRDGKLSEDEFIQAFDIRDFLEHETEIVPLLATAGNGLEIRCDVTDSRDVVWRRNDVDLALLDFPGVSVLGDGSLYLDTIGFHMVGNLTCHDRQKPTVQQIHMLTVQKPPHVSVYIPSHDCNHGSDLVIKCHVEGYPRPSVSWQFEDNFIQNGPKYHIHNFDDTLTVYNTDYKLDTGEYKCLATNMAGSAEASVPVTVHNPNDTNTSGIVAEQESFIIFHDDGYTMHEPNECLTQRHVRPDFSNFFFIPDELDAPPALCQPNVPCVWGGAINVMDMFVYVAQPRENRIIVIDVKDTFNPNQMIFTDHIPVSLTYVAHLDEVWVLCWNGETDGGSKTVIIIRNASKKSQHHSIHTQPIGNRFDLIQDIFLPAVSELHHPYRYGYTVHNGQKGLFKLDLEQKKYIKAVDLTKYDCVPTNVAFIPLGGSVLVQCVKQTAQFGTVTQLLTLDYVTDTVIANTTTSAVPYVTPDAHNVVYVDEQTGKVDIHMVSEHGEIIHQFDVTIGSPVGKATFHKASHNHGYDIHMTLKNKPVVFSVSLDNGKIDAISDVGDTDYKTTLPWFTDARPLSSGGVFSDYLATIASSSVLVLNGKQHSIQCDYHDLENPVAIAYTRLYQS